MDISDIYNGTEPPKIGTIKYHLIALALFLFAFVAFIGHSFYKINTTRLVTFALPSDTKFFHGGKLLEKINQPDHKISVYSCSLDYGKHKFIVIDSEDNIFPLELEITEYGDEPESFVFKDGTFKSY